MRPSRVAALFILLLRYFVGATVYEDDLENLTVEPIHHLNLRTLILNKTQDIHQPRLLINTARFYTTDDPALATPMVKYQATVNSPQTQSKLDDEQQPAFQNANLFPYALQMPSAIDEQQQPSNVIQKVYESSAPTSPSTDKPKNDADQQFAHKKFRHIKNGTKQVHTFTNQNRLITINNRNVHRYLKNFNVGTQYHTKVTTIAHNQVNEMIVNRQQTVLEPRLLVNLMSTGTPPSKRVAQQQEESKTSSNLNRLDSRLPIVNPPVAAEKIQQANNENETVNIERRLDTRLPDVYLPVLVEEIHNDQPPRPSSSSAANFKTEAAVSDDTFKTIIGTNDAVQMPGQSGATHQSFLLGSWDNFTPSAVSAGIVSNNPYSQSQTRENRVSPDDQFVAGAFENNVAPHHSISSDNTPKAGGTMQSLQNKFLMKQQTFAANFPVTQQSKFLSGAHTGFLLGRWDNFRPS